MPVNTSAPAAPVKKRIEHLDTMRGMCILFVNYFHSNISLMFLQYVSAICVHPFLFMAGYFFNTKKDLGETFHKKLRTMILPYYVFGIVYYLLWLAAFHGSGRDIIVPLRSVLFMPTSDFPIEPSIYFLPMMFTASMLFAVIEKYVRREWFRAALVLAITVLGNVWPRICGQRLPMSMDCAFSVLIYLYLGYNGRTIIGFFDELVQKLDSRILRLAVFFTVAVLNYICIISNYIPNLRNGVWSCIPVTHLNTCVTMLLWVYFFRWFEGLRPFALVRRALKYVGENSMIFLCFSHIGLYAGLFIVNRLPLGSGIVHDILYLVLGTLAVVPIVFLFKKTKLHYLFGK